MDAAALQGAFARPAQDSQRTFRAVMAAMAEPGTVHELAPLAAAPGFGPAMAAVALTLVDGDTPVWLAPPFQVARDWLIFQTGARTAPRADARFAFDRTVDLAGLDLGSDVYPDRSATLVVERPLSGGPALTLTGPGIERQRAFPADLGEGFVPRWQGNGAHYPRGVDLIITDGTRLAALPRTTQCMLP